LSAPNRHFKIAIRRCGLCRASFRKKRESRVPLRLLHWLQRYSGIKIPANEDQQVLRLFTQFADKVEIGGGIDHHADRFSAFSIRQQLRPASTIAFAGADRFFAISGDRKHFRGQCHHRFAACLDFATQSTGVGHGPFGIITRSYQLGFVIGIAFRAISIAACAVWAMRSHMQAQCNDAHDVHIMMRASTERCWGWQCRWP
jgi:hypothetical protein